MKLMRLSVKPPHIRLMARPRPIVKVRARAKAKARIRTMARMIIS